MTQGAPIYDFDAFAPTVKREKEKRKAAEEKKTDLKPVIKTKSQQLKDARRARAKSLKAIIVCLSLFACLAFNVYCYQLRDNVDREIRQMQEECDMINAQNTELKMKLSSMVSLEKIEKTAVEQLGLVKINPSDIEYVNTSDGSRVIISAGKIVE